jgi:hypothetical protein
LPERPAGPCLERLRIEPIHDDPMELAWLSPGPATFAPALKEFPAEPVDRVAFRPLRSGAMGDRAVLWLSLGSNPRTVVDAELFSSLTLVDVTRGIEPRRATIGRYRPEHLPGVSPRMLAAVLFRANVIRTWAHNFSELCLREETRDGARTRLRYDGVHTYNGMVREGFAFAVEVDEATNVITTTRGLDP